MYKEIQKTNYLKITLTVSLTIENAFKLKQLLTQYSFVYLYNNEGYKDYKIKTSIGYTISNDI